jgi:hypothetical protein
MVLNLSFECKYALFHWFLELVKTSLVVLLFRMLISISQFVTTVSIAKVSFLNRIPNIKKKLSKDLISRKVIKKRDVKKTSTSRLLKNSVYRTDKNIKRLL